MQRVYNSHWLLIRYYTWRQWIPITYKNKNCYLRKKSVNVDEVIYNNRNTNMTEPSENSNTFPTYKKKIIKKRFLIHWIDCQSIRVQLCKQSLSCKEKAFFLSDKNLREKKIKMHKFASTPTETYFEQNGLQNYDNQEKQQRFDEPSRPMHPVRKTHHFHALFQTELFFCNQFLELSNRKQKTTIKLNKLISSRTQKN